MTDKKEKYQIKCNFLTGTFNICGYLVRTTGGDIWCDQLENNTTLKLRSWILRVLQHLNTTTNLPVYTFCCEWWRHTSVQSMFWWWWWWFITTKNLMSRFYHTVCSWNWNFLFSSSSSLSLILLTFLSVLETSFFVLSLLSCLNVLSDFKLCLIQFEECGTLFLCTYGTQIDHHTYWKKLYSFQR